MSLPSKMWAPAGISSREPPACPRCQHHMIPEIVEWSCKRCPAEEVPAQRKSKKPKNDESTGDDHGTRKDDEGGKGNVSGKPPPWEPWPHPWATPWDPRITDGRRKHSQEWCRRKGLVPKQFDADSRKWFAEQKGKGPDGLLLN